MRFNVHHIHQRKRIHEKFEEYPHPNPKIRFLDDLLLAVVVIGPLTNLPQVFQIFYSKNAAGVSLISFSFFAFFNTFWIAYGLVHREKPIIIASFLWFATNLMVVAGIIMYG